MRTATALTTDCRQAQRLAENERLNEAVERLGDIWRGPLEYPHIPDQDLKSLILTTVADISARIGHEEHIAGSQEHVKNLLSEAISLLEDEGEDTADAYLKLAITYLREGAYDECRVLITRTDPQEDRLKAKKALIQAVLYSRAGCPLHAFHTLNDAQELFAGIGETLRGKFHLQRAIALNDLERTDRSILEYQAATVYFEEGQNQRYLLAVRTDLAELFFGLGDHAGALRNIDLAIRSARSQNSKNTLGSCNETKARILLKEGRLSEARRAINEAVGIFRQGDEHSLHSEALVTQGRILAKLGLEAKPVFERAIKEAELGDPMGVANACLAMTEELPLSYSEIADLYVRADEALNEAQKSEMLARLQKCARKVIAYSPHTFEEVKQMNLRNEALAIDAALVESKGSVRGAAKILGTTHANVRYHLQRNPNSKAKRKPASKRSIIR